MPRNQPTEFRRQLNLARRNLPPPIDAIASLTFIIVWGVFVLAPIYLGGN